MLLLINEAKRRGSPLHSIRLIGYSLFGHRLSEIHNRKRSTSIHIDH